MADYQHWLLNLDDRVATLTLNRAEVMNSLTPEVLFELRDITRRLQEDRDVWAVVVQGAGDLALPAPAAPRVVAGDPEPLDVQRREDAFGAPRAEDPEEEVGDGPLRVAQRRLGHLPVPLDAGHCQFTVRGDGPFTGERRL